MAIDINTRFITLIGDPLGQSFAARMQNAAYNAAKLNMEYFYTETGSEHLGEIINGIRYMPSFAGCAVTKPNKVNVLQFLDELDPLCKKMGACNTVVKTSDGKLRGYNTDGSGFYTAFTREGGRKAEGESFFLIGAGGAGRAIGSALAYNGAAHIYICDIIPAAAEALTKDINENFAQVAQQVEFGCFDMAEGCSCVINATGIGMGHTMGQSPMPKALMKPDVFYFDACYNPDKTQFLLDAESIGAKIMNGLAMSLYQGVEQIELWSGGEAPVEVMRAELKTILAEKG